MTLGPDGEFRASEYEDDVSESIRIILKTSKGGERVMRPDFGCGIHDYVFDTVDTATLGIIESSVRDALVKWEPRIDVLGIRALTEEISKGILPVRVDYRVRATNNQFNLVYPFYLREGK